MLKRESKIIMLRPNALPVSADAIAAREEAKRQQQRELQNEKAKRLVWSLLPAYMKVRQQQQAAAGDDDDDVLLSTGGVNGGESGRRMQVIKALLEASKRMQTEREDAQLWDELDSSVLGPAVGGSSQTTVTEPVAAKPANRGPPKPGEHKHRTMELRKKSQLFRERCAMQQSSFTALAAVQPDGAPAAGAISSEADLRDSSPLHQSSSGIQWILPSNGAGIFDALPQPPELIVSLAPQQVAGGAAQRAEVCGIGRGNQQLTLNTVVLEDAVQRQSAAAGGGATSFLSAASPITAVAGMTPRGERRTASSGRTYSPSAHDYASRHGFEAAREYEEQLANEILHCVPGGGRFLQPVSKSPTGEAMLAQAAARHAPPVLERELRRRSLHELAEERQHADDMLASLAASKCKQALISQQSDVCATPELSQTHASCPARKDGKSASSASMVLVESNRADVMLRSIASHTVPFVHIHEAHQSQRLRPTSERSQHGGLSSPSRAPATFRTQLSAGYVSHDQFTSVSDHEGSHIAPNGPAQSKALSPPAASKRKLSMSVSELQSPLGDGAVPPAASTPTLSGSTRWRKTLSEKDVSPLTAVETPSSTTAQGLPEPVPLSNVAKRCAMVPLNYVSIVRDDDKTSSSSQKAPGEIGAGDALQPSRRRRSTATIRVFDLARDALSQYDKKESSKGSTLVCIPHHFPRASCSSPLLGADDSDRMELTKEDDENHQVAPVNVGCPQAYATERVNSPVHAIASRSTSPAPVLRSKTPDSSTRDTVCASIETVGALAGGQQKQQATNSDRPPSGRLPSVIGARPSSSQPQVVRNTNGLGDGMRRPASSGDQRRERPSSSSTPSVFLRLSRPSSAASSAHRSDAGDSASVAQHFSIDSLLSVVDTYGRVVDMSSFQPPDELSTRTCILDATPQVAAKDRVALSLARLTPPPFPRPALAEAIPTGVSPSHMSPTRDPVFERPLCSPSADATHTSAVASSRNLARRADALGGSAMVRRWMQFQMVRPEDRLNATLPVTSVLSRPPSADTATHSLAASKQHLTTSDSSPPRWTSDERKVDESGVLLQEHKKKAEQRRAAALQRKIAIQTMFCRQHSKNKKNKQTSAI